MGPNEERPLTRSFEVDSTDESYGKISESRSFHRDQRKGPEGREIQPNASSRSSANIQQVILVTFAAIR